MTMPSHEAPVISPAPFSPGIASSGGWLNESRREALAAYAFISPALILFVVFIAGPLIGAIGLSFYSWDLFTPREYVGLQNYRELRHDDVAQLAIKNSFYFAFWSIVLHITVGMTLALAVNRAIHGPLRYFLRTAY